jgi:polyhydroxyalkanoate synthase
MNKTKASHFSFQDFGQEFIEFSLSLTKASEHYKTRDNVEIGKSSKKVVFQIGKLSLYHYQPCVKLLKKIPLLIVFALVNRPTILDLSKECSMIKSLLKEGIDVYSIDWGYPDHNDGNFSLTDYIARNLQQCVQFVRKQTHQKQINLLGICQGGVFSLCYGCLYPQNVKNLITVTTPVDFHTNDNIIYRLLSQVDIDLLVNKLGNIPGHLLTRFFMSLNPYRLIGKKYLGFVAKADDVDFVNNFMRVEKWLFDSPDQAGEAFREFTKNFYQQNKLIKGEICLDKKQIDLYRLTMPILNIIADEDHLIPPSASIALQNCIATTDYSQYSLSGGHIGLYISHKTRHKLVQIISQWLKQRI